MHPATTTLNHKSMHCTLKCSLSFSPKMPWWWCLPYFCQITCKATSPGSFLDPYAFTRARWMFGVTLFQEFKLYWKNYIFQVINWQMDSQDTANNMNKIASQKKTVFLVQHLQRPCFLYIIPQGNLLPKIKCLAVSCQRNFSFHPPIYEQNLDISASIG